VKMAAKTKFVSENTLDQEGITISSDPAVAIAVDREKRTPRIQKRFKVEIDERLCKGCCFCIRFCPMGVFVRSDTLGDLGYKMAKVEFPENCSGCRACLLYCPDLAVAVEEEGEKKN